jgi:DNA-binding response OmpR family regulator
VQATKEHEVYVAILANAAATLTPQGWAEVLREAAALRGTEFLKFMFQISQAAMKHGDGIVADVAPAHWGVKQIGALLVDPQRPRSCEVDGRRVPLSSKQGQLLQVLALEPGRPVSAELLIKTLWPEDWDGCADLDLLLNRLRQLTSSLRKRIEPAAAISYEERLGYILEEAAA